MGHMFVEPKATAKTMAALIAGLRSFAEPLPGFDRAEQFGCLFDRFADARVVLLGEATHGSSEFYRARSVITRRLIEQHGFNIVTVEADWPDAARIDDYVRHRAPRPRLGDPFVRFPTWMWRNVETLEFADWLRVHNQSLAEKQRVSFHGLDIYSLDESIHAVLAYLDRVDPTAAVAARARYGCLTPWQHDPAAYGRAVVQGQRGSCEDGAIEQLKCLLADRIRSIQENGDDWFNAIQNARIVRAAERYYRAMYQGATESWNLRDRHMFQTLQALLTHRGDAARAVVWAHNSHVGNAAATAMGWQGEFNIGELCRMAHGDEAVSIGFGTNTGIVAAASDWGGPTEFKTVRPARLDSYEGAFACAGLSPTLSEWRTPAHSALRELVSAPMLERAIGVVYRPETELTSHYFQAVLAEQFDAWVWFDQTTAITPLGTERPSGAPETYPFGL